MAAKKRILCISDDATLLTTQKLILEGEGFEVTTAFGFPEASKACSSRPAFDLVVLSHTIPLQEKAALVKTFRQNSSSPILLIASPVEALPPGTEYSIASLAGPRVLIDTVKKALGESASST